MDSAVSKLVDAFIAAVSRLGGEASRLYPDVIRLYVWENILPAVLVLPFVVAGYIIEAKLIAKAKHDAYGAGMLMMAIFGGIGTVILTIVFVCFTYSAIRVLIAPEAAFILDHLPGAK